MTHVFGVLAAHTHLDERLDLRLDAIELDGNELRVLRRLPVVVESQLRVGETVLQRPDDTLIPAGLRRFETRADVARSRREVLVAGAAKESIEAVLRHEQSQEEVQQPVERRRSNRLGRV